MPSYEINGFTQKTVVVTTDEGILQETGGGTTKKFTFDPISLDSVNKSVGINKAPVNGVELSIDDTMRIYSGSNYSEFNQTAGTGRWKTISGAGTSCEINIDPIPDGGASSSLNSAIRLWRNVTTTGNRNLVFYKGDGTATAHSRIAVDGLWSFFTNTSIHIGGSSDPGSDVLKVTGNAKFIGDFTIDSTTSGFLPPRMTTTQKNAISTPATGLIVFDNTLNEISFFNGTAWQKITGYAAG